MTDLSKRKRPLVADKRYPSKGKPTAKKPAKKSVKNAAPVKRKARKPQRPKRGGIIGFFTGIISWVLRLIWKITWRLTAAVVLVLAVIVGYLYTTLPPLEALLDGRARGSVTLLDRDGEVFAWRGDQFGGVVTADLSHLISRTRSSRQRTSGSTVISGSAPGASPRRCASTLARGAARCRGTAVRRSHSRLRN